MKAAIQKAELYTNANNPYDGTSVYPYVWKWSPETKSIWLSMGKRGDDEFTATFTFDPTVPGVIVHVAVWAMSKAGASELTARPSKDVGLHMLSVNHFKATLLGIPGSLEAYMVPPAPVDG